MDNAEIRSQIDRKRESESSDNVAMRTASFGHGMHGLEVCAKRETYMVKGPRRAGVEKW
jgi:hypothetical protein